LVTGPTALTPPDNVTTISIETADQMKQAVLNSLTADIFVGTAAVADWKVTTPATQKMKKRVGGEAPTLNFTENPDILSLVGHHEKRPKLVIGFAAETENVIENARLKLTKKGCDWIIANQVGIEENQGFGENENQVTLMKLTTTDSWPKMSKVDISKMLVAKIIEELNTDEPSKNRH
jgi:phosphopantothenoylcysteine decarboxylase/phosphopantothenate--cysteine ligase